MCNTKRCLMGKFGYNLFVDKQKKKTQLKYFTFLEVQEEEYTTVKILQVIEYLSFPSIDFINIWICCWTNFFAKFDFIFIYHLYHYIKRINVKNNHGLCLS